MKIVRPITEEKLRELEKELELQKNRFFRATDETIRIVKRDLSLLNWIRSYPVQTTALIFAGGFLISHFLFKTNKDKNSP